MLGRRGPAQAAFTNPEVRELGELTDADIVIDPAEVELDPASRAYFESEDCDPTHRRNVEIFTEFSQRPPEGKPKRVVMRFCCSPVEIRGDGKVERIVIGRNELDARRVGRDPRPRHRRARGDRVRPGAALDRLQGHRARGRSPSTPGRGVIPNEAGRVIDPDTGEQVPGHYVVGWIKRGPSGVIGTNKKDAPDTVEHDLRGPRGGRIPSSRRPARPQAKPRTGAEVSLEL